MATIDLSIANLNVSLELFDSGDYPRITAEGQDATVTFAPTGAVVGDGRVTEEKFLWDVTVYCSEQQEQLLRLIQAEHAARRRELGNANILLVDRTQLFEERYPRTRAIASDTSEIIYPAATPTHVLYYAQFYAWMPQRPTFTSKGPKRLATFTLIETDRVAA